MLPTINFNTISGETTLPKAKQAQFFMVGDKVLWKGIKLTVINVKANGEIEAHSPTMFLTVSDASQLERYTCQSPTTTI